RTVSWWDTATGREVRRFPGHARGVESLALSADDRTLIALDKAGTTHVWDTESGQLTRTVKGEPLFNALYSPEGKSLVYFAGQPPALKVRNVLSGGEARSFEGPEPTFGFLRFAFSPDGRLLLTMGNDQSLQVWDLAAARAIRRLSPVVDGVA